jgi:curli biogenesis system outer membrane secretion channel CsgG
MRLGSKGVVGAVLAVAMTMAGWPAAAQIKSSHSESAEDTRAKKTNELPQCAKPLGTIAVSEPENRWWTELSLSSPEALIRVYVQQSHCFKLVNRSQRGMAAMQQERALASSGDLRKGGAVGKGQMVEADFTVIPDIVTQNGNKGGMNVGGLVGGLLGGAVGGLVGGINVKKKSADVVLNVVNNKTSEEFVAEGQSKKTDLGWGGGGGIFGGGFLAAGGASGYDNTEIGQVIALAYLDAYTKLVNQIGELKDSIGGPAEQKAVTLTRPSRMFATPSLKGKLVKTLDAGAILYPTGNKQDGFWEVEDELGTKGWVPEAGLAVAK